MVPCKSECIDANGATRSTYLVSTRNIGGGLRQLDVLLVEISVCVCSNLSSVVSKACASIFSNECDNDKDDGGDKEYDDENDIGDR